MNGPSEDWVRNMAEIEDGECVSVGGMADDFAMLLNASAKKICELQDQVSRKPSAMVLEYQPELTHSVWIDYISEDADTKQQLIDELKEGVKDGRWVGWRLILVEREVMGNE